MLAGLLFMLGLLGASPVLHAELHHDHDHAPAHADDSGCVVLAFAHGVTTPAPAPRVEPPVASAAPVRFAPPAAPVVATAEHLRPPGRAPPAVD